jgi:uncharacterized membrane protein YgcG
MKVPERIGMFMSVRALKKHINALSIAMVAVCFVTIFLPVLSSAKTYYVSPGGNDAAAGTIDQPFLTIVKAHSVVAAGDTIFVRGGNYVVNATINLSKNGTGTSGFFLLAYPGGRPILDFSSMTVSSGNRGIQLSGSYWYIKGFDVKGAGDNGMFISGSFNTVEFCALFENRDTGLQIGNGASNNRIINCDSYYNVDPSQGNADGFSPKLDVGTANYFYGCRSWQNSDDGWDGYLRPSNDVTTTLENCWSFNNGYLKNGGASSGNGNGFKMGGGDNGNSDHLKHNMILKRCLAFDNRVKGFDQNNNVGSMTLYNCTAYRNGTNYSISSTLDSGKTLIVINCVSLGSYGSLGSFAAQQTNSWLSPFGVSNADFVSVDTGGVRGPRKADGSLPDLLFMHLAPGSRLIDAGTIIGMPYGGTAPDLGAFEYGTTTSVNNERELFSPETFTLSQNFPNPFNPTTTIRYWLPSAGPVSLRVYDTLGREVAVLVAAVESLGEHLVQFNAGLFPSGTYFARLTWAAHTKTVTLVLVK